MLDPALTGPVDRFVGELTPELTRISPQIVERDIALEAYKAELRNRAISGAI